MQTLIAPAARPPEVLAGELIGRRYRVRRPLGHGGTAAVYLADDETLGRPVALKVLSADLSLSGRWVRRFRKEARAVARLAHEHIVKIYDYGETDEGLLYFVMEYLPGRSLAEALCGQPLPLHRLRPVALQICQAISAAHQEGIVHRDLKPANIMLLPREDGRDLVKVLDFGIASILEDDEPDDGRLTAIGQTIGTPEYMAPEQILGEAPDPRSDIYAAGCVLYELLTGDVPFSAEPRERVRYLHVFEPPEPPSQRLGTPLPPALEAICLRALEKRPERRFPSMAAMADALQQEAERAQGVEILLELEEEEGTRRDGRAWRWVALGGVILLGVIGGLWARMAERPEAASRSTSTSASAFASAATATATATATSAATATATATSAATATATATATAVPAPVRVRTGRRRVPVQASAEKPAEELPVPGELPLSSPTARGAR
jgi:serine/threonine protein kinase